ncbi:6-bladed beta-propeller [Mucilaginibacter sp. UYCu711]|uniref:6-bladed beta-propeller n=1 Tax=Mucilaginibacter sp. UYCu711 TaxID=3156339 RepID=UPI003D1C7596
MKPKLFTTLLFFVLLQGIAIAQAPSLPFKDVKQTEIEKAGAIEIRLDPGSAITDEPISSIVETVTYLPLQTTPASLFGEISQLEATDKYYIIWDEISNSIVFFDKKGEYVTKITNTDKTVETPYKKIDHFAVNESKNELIFNDRYSMLMYYYTLDGKFIKSIQKPSYIGNSYSSFKNYNAYYQSYNHENLANLKIPANNLLLVDDSGKAKTYLPYDTIAIKSQYGLYGIDRNFFNNQNGVIYFLNNYDYNIYTIDSFGRVTVKYRFVMPAVNTFPDDFMTNKNYDDKRKAYTDADNRVIYTLTDFFQRENVLVFRFWGHGRNQLSVFNLQTQSLVSLTEMSADKMTFDLPFISKPLVSVDRNNQFIFANSAASLFAAKTKLLQKNKNWLASLPEALSTFFKSNSQQNPVLTFIKFKQQ